jgi:uncharacterized protein YeaO (DUF488 family)
MRDLRRPTRPRRLLDELKLRLFTARAGSPRTSGEGLRIGAVRFLPRGVRKRDYARLNYFDVWLPALAPSRSLLSKYKKSGTPPRAFLRLYEKEMQTAEARQLLTLLAEIAKRTPLALCCYCEDESKCHRSVLVRLVRNAEQL